MSCKNITSRLRIRSLCGLLFCLWLVPAWADDFDNILQVRMDKDYSYYKSINTIPPGAGYGWYGINADFGHVREMGRFVESRANARINQINARLDRLEGLPGQVAEVKNTNEQYRAETNRIKEETKAATSRLDASAASASEDYKKQNAELLKQRQEFENYKKQVEEEKKATLANNKRQERIYDAFGDIFSYGKIQDLVMVELFAKASELSPEFKTIYEELKTVPKIRQLFKQKIYRMIELLDDIVKAHKDLENLFYQPVQLAPGISGSSDGLLELGSGLHNEL